MIRVYNLRDINLSVALLILIDRIGVYNTQDVIDWTVKLFIDGVLSLSFITCDVYFIFRPVSVMTKRKRPLGKSALESRPKLFGGSIEEYVQVWYN